MDEQDTALDKGTTHFTPVGKKYATLRNTQHTLNKKVFDNALKEAEKLGISVSEYMARVLDATRNLD